jgi:hypothetical protein
MNYNSYIGNLFAAFSQFLHAISGGDRDISISGMLWETRRKNWKRKYVDFTFQLIDGKDHCQRAYKSDDAEEYHVRQPKEWAITIFVLFWCTLINIFNPLIWVIKTVN